MKHAFYGKGLPGIDLKELKGSLIVIEGGDGAGRSTQIKLLKDSLERRGFPVAEVGLKRSDLVGKELNEAMRGHVLCPTTLALFYMTDFADQLENVTIPALRAGFVVLADRYIFTLLARHAVRGVDSKWLTDVCGLALVPQLSFYLEVTPKTLASRSFRKSGTLDFWESGMDIKRSGDMYQCFTSYQAELADEFEALTKRYKIVKVAGEADPAHTHAFIAERVQKMLLARAEKGDRGESNKAQAAKKVKKSTKRAAT
jgi:dTMP kinase